MKKIIRLIVVGSLVPVISIAHGKTGTGGTRVRLEVATINAGQVMRHAKAITPSSLTGRPGSTGGTPNDWNREAPLGSALIQQQPCPELNGIHDPPVVSLTASPKELTAYALTTDRNVVPGAPVAGLVRLEAVPSVNPHQFDYSYAVKRGTIIGTGNRVFWDLSAAEPGEYKVTVQVDDRCGRISWVDAVVKVRSTESTEAVDTIIPATEPSSGPPKIHPALKLAIAPQALTFSRIDGGTPPGGVEAESSVVSVGIEPSGWEEMGLEIRYRVSGGRVERDRNNLQWSLANFERGSYKIAVEMFDHDRLVDLAVGTVEVSVPPEGDDANTDESSATEGTADSSGSADFDLESEPAKGDDADLHEADIDEVTEDTSDGKPVGAVFAYMPTVSLSSSAPYVYSTTARENNSSENMVDLVATATDPMACSLLLTYTVTGGRIEGKGANVKWNLQGVRPGIYKALVEVNNGAGRINFDLVEVTVY